MGLVRSIMRERRASAGLSFSANSDPPGWWSRIFGGGMTHAGVEMDEWRALNLSTVWCCVGAIAIDIAKLPFHWYRRLDGGGKERLLDHPAAWLINVEANPEMAAIDFWDTLQWWTLNWGNGLAEIERRGNGRPLYLWPLEPWCTRVMRDSQNALYYEYTPPRGPNAGRKRNIPAADVLHLKGMGNGIVGLNVVRYARESLAGHAAAEEFGHRFFANGAHGGGILTHPAKVGPKALDNLRDSWEEKYSGAQHAGKPIILEEGMKWEKMAFPPEEAQYLETKQFSIPDICRWYRFPPHKAGDLSRATFSNIEQQDLQYVGDTLFSWIRRQEVEAARKLLMPSERREVFAERLLDAQLRADIESRYDAYATAKQNGWLNANEIRERENMNPIKGGEVYTVQVNMTTPDKLGQKAAAADTASGDGGPGDGQDPQADQPAARAALCASFRDLLEYVYVRVLQTERDKVVRAAGKPDFQAWLARFTTERDELLRGDLFPIVEALSEALAAAGQRPPAGAVRRAVHKLTARHRRRSELDLGVAGSIEARTSSWATTRAGEQAGDHAAALAELMAPPIARPPHPPEPSPEPAPKPKE